jgi:hypothetical protein
MRPKPPKVEPEGWENNAFKVYFANLQQREQERTWMNLSTQIHGTLYISKEILHTYQEAQGGMETTSTNIGFVWQFV